METRPEILTPPVGSAPALALPEPPALSWPRAALWAVVAVGAFQLACEFPALGALVVLQLYGLTRLTELRTGRAAFYAGLAVGLALFAPQLTFFWTIFGPSAIALWLVLAFWIALFVTLGRLCRRKFGALGLALLPFLWTGLEYFRSEGYYLRFSWLNAGSVFAGSSSILSHTHLGMYGVGFGLMIVVAVLVRQRGRQAWFVGSLLLAALAVFGNLPPVRSPSIVAPGRTLRVAGVQLEFPGEAQVLTALNQLLRAHPDTELFLLSEYTFDGPVPEAVKMWCREHQRHLVVGGKDARPDGSYFNTAFVVGPRGDLVFQQAKSVPIQFFQDGRPAREQAVWASPWGKLGLCICYDLSYTRVVDQLVRLGAEAILVPTMDVEAWGERQHRLHARVAPVRAAEYGVPIFRVCSSGLSQLVERDGFVQSSAPFPGELAMLAGELRLNGPGRLPLDRWLGPAAAGVTGLVLVGLLGSALAARRRIPSRS